MKCLQVCADWSLKLAFKARADYKGAPFFRNFIITQFGICCLLCVHTSAFIWYVTLFFLSVLCLYFQFCPSIFFLFFKCLASTVSSQRNCILLHNTTIILRSLNHQFKRVWLRRWVHISLFVFMDHDFRYILVWSFSFIYTFIFSSPQTQSIQLHYHSRAERHLGTAIASS